MGWRFLWTLHIERDDEGREPGEAPRGLIKWAILGLAVFGACAVILVNYYNR